jgi:hypothetical protein
LCKLTNRANNAKTNLTVKKGEKQGTLAERENSVPLTSIDKLVQISSISIEKFILLFTKQATLARRSTVLSFFLQLAFPGGGVR